MEIESEILLKDLRKRSRTLLAHTLENSKKINNEINRLRLQSLEVNKYRKGNGDKLNFLPKSKFKSWKLRNDSSAINSLICSDYLSRNKTYTFASTHNMQPTERHIESMKNRLHTTCSCINRKSIKECYCNVTARRAKVHSQRTRCRSSSPSHFKKHDYQVNRSNDDCDTKEQFSPPISCETVRRVQKISYSPKSQFLRNVQNKISSLKGGPAGDFCDTCPRLSYYHKFATFKDAHSTDTNTASKYTDKANNKPIVNSHKLKPDVTNQTDSIRREEKYSQYEPAKKSDKGVQVSTEKIAKPKPIIKRTISSKKIVPDKRKEKSLLKIPFKDKKNASLRPEEYLLYSKSRSKRSVRDTESKKLSSTSGHTTTPKTRSPEGEQIQPSLFNNEINDLQKFREQNYFDTHASNQTFVSSDSSELLSQYTLNERLFPEPYAKIRKSDLVVTIPSCSTVQKKQIHYIPKYIVQQEKNTFNTNYKKKRCHRCPLTGHAVDLGVLKPRATLNSLALKYQKILP